MVIAYHLVWVAYGWWLPNDPRGSMSTQVCSDVLRDLGALHHGRKRVQPAGREIRVFYEAARSRLDHALLTFSEFEMHAIASAIGRTIHDNRYTCYGAAVMPDHVHLLIRKHRHLAEEMISNFQHDSADAVRKLAQRDSYHPVWGGPGWKVFLDTPQDIERTIRYIDENPIKARLPRQGWEFVTPYDNWPFHRRGRSG